MPVLHSLWIFLFVAQECQMTPVIHILKHPGCIPKAIPSFACIGKCSSYVQVTKIVFELKVFIS